MSREMFYADIWGESHRGRVRSANEDTIFFSSRPRSSVTPEQAAARGHLLAVADGVGGESGGKDASRQVIQGLVEAYYRSAVPSPFDPLENLRRAVQKANAWAHQYCKRTFPKAATTLVAAVLWRNCLYVVNIGDSRAYLIRDGQAQQLTVDHAVAGGTLTRSMATAPTVQPDVFLPLALKLDDRVLLCSDGLYEPVPESETLGRMAGRGAAQRVARRLVSLANRLGGPDNVSVVVAHVRSRPPSALRTSLLSINLWQSALLVGLAVLVLMMLILLVKEIKRVPSVPTLAPTAAVPIETLAREPTTARSTNGAPVGESITPTTAASGVGGASRATSTRAPSSTPTWTPPPPTLTLAPPPSSTWTATPVVPAATQPPPTQPPPPPPPTPTSEPRPPSTWTATPTVLAGTQLPPTQPPSLPTDVPPTAEIPVPLPTDPSSSTRGIPGSGS